MNIVILAAGQGKRMVSDLPKVLHPIAGKPLVGHVLDTARQLKEMNAKRVFICCTFGLFTNGLESFDKAYENCWFDRVITTNLTYQPPEIYTRPYYTEADMSKFLASIIDFMNHDVSMSHVMTPTEKINEILARYNNREEYHI